MDKVKEVDAEVDKKVDKEDNDLDLDSLVGLSGSLTRRINLGADPLNDLLALHLTRSLAFLPWAGSQSRPAAKLSVWPRELMLDCNTMQYRAVTCNTIAVTCNTMQYRAVTCNTSKYQSSQFDGGN